MNKLNKPEEKRMYVSPAIEQILLDNEISLAMESDAPIGPYEHIKLFSQDHFNTDPYNSPLG